MFADPPAPPDEPPAPDPEADRPAPDPDRPPSALEGWVTFGIVLAAALFTFVQFEPELIFRATTPNGGDMGAHVWAPAYLRDHLLPNFRLTGWTNDWYAGFPALRFYMVPPMLAIVILDVVVPYGVAFKVVAVSGIVALPISCWAFGRLAGVRFPGPALFALAGVAFAFHRDYTIYGGNALSTLAGEFAFTISLNLAIIWLGLVVNGFRTGRHRAVAAVVVAMCALTHVIPLIFAVVGAFVALAVHPTRRAVRWLATTAPVGALMALWWLLPFWWQRSHLNDMGWSRTLPPDGVGWTERIGFWVTFILPAENAWRASVPGLDAPVRLDLALMGVAVVAVLALDRTRLGRVLVATLAVGAAGVVLVPQGRLWNARLTPFTHLLAYLIVALAVALAIRRLAALIGPAIRRIDPLDLDGAGLLRIGGALAATAVLIVMVALPLRTLPGGVTRADGSYHWLFLSTTERSNVPGWARWNFRGYEDKDAWPEYEDMLLTMRNLGETNGCGRAMWEYEHERLDRYGTPMAPMLLPFWTDGCIASMEGLYFESATTTPFHFLNQSALSASPSRPQRNLPYRGFDIDLGVAQLQLLGVRYYMAFTETAVRAAAAHPDLDEVARSGPWVIYEVADAPLVEPLTHLPNVLDPSPHDNEGWIEATADWFQTPALWDVHLAADGPTDWPRAAPATRVTPVEVDAVEVSNVVLDRDRISFDVSEPGVPVLVKVSHFPNWRADGADGPWRVSPSFMVVVPTDTHVELHYGTHPVEVAGWGLTLLGLVGLVLLLRAGPVGDGTGPVPSRRGPAPGDRRLSVVVPAYQEAEVVAGTVASLRAALVDLDPDVEIIVVDDGSTDGTAGLARSAGADQVVVHSQNRGKGAAVRTGMLAATGRTVVFTDADLAYSPDQVERVAVEVEAGWDVVLGSRQATGSVAEVQASFLRRIGGRVVNLAVRQVVPGHLDTQCGIKAFRSDVGRLLFGDARIDGFGFDVEIVALAQHHGLSVAEVPVRVVNSTRSSLHVVRDGLQMLGDLGRIAWWRRRGRYRASGHHDLPPAGGVVDDD